jgi:hypothetical protein
MAEEPWLTVCAVQDRLIDAGLGRLDGTDVGLATFRSDAVALGLSDRGFTVYVYDRINVAKVKKVFRDAPQIKVQFHSRTKPLG